MSTSTSVSKSKRGAAPAGEPGRPRPSFRWSRLWWLLPVGVAVGVFEPHCFRYLIAQALRLEGWRQGASVQVARVDGSVLEPVTFLGVNVSRESRGGAVTRFEVKEATARFSWRNLLKQGSARWLERVTLDGVAGKMELPAEPTVQRDRFTVRRWLPDVDLTPAPGRVEVRGIDVIFQVKDEYVRLQDARCTLSAAEPGTFAAGQLIVKQPWLERTFRDLRGTTRIDGTEIGIADVELEPGVKLEKFAAELAELARGNLNATGHFNAFDGVVRFETRTMSGQPALTEITGSLAGVNVAKLATFLATPNAAGGTIKDGKFTFRGSPRRPAEATATLRMDVTNFQWDARQWDSLVLGSRLMNGRLEVLQLELLQGKNRLDVDGEVALPASGRRWWQSAFDARIKAQIEDLTALSALLLPEFRYAAGRATIEGAIRGREEKINGQLVVNGFGLQWRSAPIEELQAALKFTGNELEVTNVALFNDGDFLRGRGRVNLSAPHDYRGELRAAVQDLATYRALLQPPIVPEPLAGGATVTWQGESAKGAHTGTFRAQLNKLRSLGATATRLHPINAALEGAYEPGKVAFSQFALSDDVSAFSANVKVGDKGVSLRDVNLRHRDQLCLEGDAVLPLDVWKAWPNTSLAGLLDDTAPTSVNLKANALSLQEASALSGWNFPVAGRVTGNFTAEGRLGALQLGGQLTLAEGRMRLDAAGREVRDVEASATFREQIMQVEKLSGSHPAGAFRVEGAVDLAKVREPQLKLAFKSEQLTAGLCAGRGQASAAVSLAIEGPAGAAIVRGEARPLSVGLGVIDLAPLWADAAARVLPPVLAPIEPVLAGWKLDVSCATAEPVGLEGNSGRVSLAGQIAGSPSVPIWTGRATFADFTASVRAERLTVESGTMEFRPSEVANPSVDLAVTGAIFGEVFHAHFTGPLSHLLREIDAPALLSDAAVRDFLVGGNTAGPGEAAPLTLRVPAILSGGVDVHEWASISSAPTPAPIPTPAPAAAPAPGQ